MIEARAVVLDVEHGFAHVRVSDRQDGCGRCDEPGGCRSVRIAHALKAPTEVFRVADTLGLHPGDTVFVRMDGGAPLRVAMVSYGLGAALLVAGAALGHAWAGAGQEDIHALVGACSGLALAVMINRLLFFSRRWRDRLQIALVRDESPCVHVSAQEGQV